MHLQQYFHAPIKYKLTFILSYFQNKHAAAGLLENGQETTHGLTETVKVSRVWIERGKQVNGRRSRWVVVWAAAFVAFSRSEILTTPQPQLSSVWKWPEQICKELKARGTISGLRFRQKDLNPEVEAEISACV